MKIFFLTRDELVVRNAQSKRKSFVSNCLIRLGLISYFWKDGFVKKLSNLLRVTYPSIEATGLKFGMQNPHMDGSKVTIQVFDILLRS